MLSTLSSAFLRGIQILSISLKDTTHVAHHPIKRNSINIVFDLKAALCVCVFSAIHLCVVVVFYKNKTVLIQISRVLMRAADQNPHCFGMHSM